MLAGLLTHETGDPQSKLKSQTSQISKLCVQAREFDSTKGEEWPGGCGAHL